MRKKYKIEKEKEVLMIWSGNAGSEKVLYGLYKSMGFLETHSQFDPEKFGSTSRRSGVFRWKHFPGMRERFFYN